MKKSSKLLLIATVAILMGTIKTYATDEEPIPVTPVDNVAPVFSSNIQKRYVVKKAEDGSTFDPSKVIKGIQATDNVDGKDVTISLVYNSVDLSQDGEYQVLYSATDKSGNTSYCSILVDVDGIAPAFDQTQETTYYMTKSGIIYDSKHNVVEAIPEKLVAKESMGAYKGIGVYITNNEKGDIIFIEMVKNTPAERNLKINDILVEVDGEDVRGADTAYVASKIKGEEGTTVELQLIRNKEEITVTLERELIKLYDDKDVIAEPDVSINTIDKEENGKIEITYTATDEAGNTSEFIITVIIIDDEETVAQNKEEKESEELYNVTTSGTPPEGINIEKETELEEKLTVEKDTTEKEEVVKEEKVKVENTENENIELEEKAEEIIEQ